MSEFGQQTVQMRVWITGWISFVLNVLIIGTGGAVRLTGSGLGCPTWPTCDGTSVVATEAMGIHGIIEFGNRTLTGALGISALAVIWAVWRIRRNRRDLWWIAILVLAGILAQAVVGGITVLTGLNPIIVGFHYIASLVLVVATALFLVRAREDRGVLPQSPPAWFRWTTALTSVVVLVTVALGVLTTGAGPHSGDAAAGRNGFNAELLEHLHAWPGYLTFTGAAVLAIAALRFAPALRVWTAALLAVVLIQIAVGLVQARTGLPPLLVGIHMVLAAVLVAVMAVVAQRVWLSRGTLNS